MQPMKTCDEIRRDRLADLKQQFQGVSGLAQILGKSETQIRQWLNGSKDSKTGKPRGISDEVARQIEAKTGRPRGWLDHEIDLVARGSDGTVVFAQVKSGPLRDVERQEAVQTFAQQYARLAELFAAASPDGRQQILLFSEGVEKAIAALPSSSLGLDQN